MKPLLLSIQHLSCGRRTRSGRLLLRGVNISANNGDFIGIIGPNGAGKTTLLRIILNLVPKSGDIWIDGKNTDTIRRGELAKLISMVPQRIEAMDWFTVEEMISIGRTPYLGQFGGLHERDRETVETVLRMVEAAADRDRILTTLSGGEMQRVLIGRAIAQEPKVLLLDEPTAHLDIKYQLEVLDMLRDLLSGELVGAIRKPETIVATFHNINLAADYCSKLVLLSKGEVVAQGTPEAVLTAENIRQVYGVEAFIDRHPKSGKPHYFILQ